jgi:GTPase SAR1 family protein
MENSKTYRNYHKVAIIGPRNVGKSTLTNILIGNNFNPDYDPSESNFV